MTEPALDRKEIIVAGGSGGIGAAVTGLLVAEGARVIVSYQSHPERASRWSSRHV